MSTSDVTAVTLQDPSARKRKALGIYVRKGGGGIFPTTSRARAPERAGGGWEGAAAVGHLEEGQGVGAAVGRLKGPRGRGGPCRAPKGTGEGGGGYREAELLLPLLHPSLSPELLGALSRISPEAALCQQPPRGALPPTPGTDSSSSQSSAMPGWGGCVVGAGAHRRLLCV